MAKNFKPRFFNVYDTMDDLSPKAQYNYARKSARMRYQGGARTGFARNAYTTRVATAAARYAGEFVGSAQALFDAVRRQGRVLLNNIPGYFKKIGANLYAVGKRVYHVVRNKTGKFVVTLKDYAVQAVKKYDKWVMDNVASPMVRKPKYRKKMKGRGKAAAVVNAAVDKRNAAAEEKYNLRLRRTTNAVHLATATLAMKGIGLATRSSREDR